MSYEIQPGIVCENCIKCGTRPVIDEIKKGWVVKCPNEQCKNEVVGPLVDIETWDRINKKTPDLKPGEAKDMMRSA